MGHETIWEFFSEIFGSKVSNKSAPEMELLGYLLDAMKIVDKETFLQRYATTIGTTIYLPERERTEWEDVIVATHEHEHIARWLHNPPEFTLLYVTNPAYRALEEARAYASGMALHHWRYGVVPPIEPILGSLSAYALGSDIETAAIALRGHARSIREGGYTSQCAQLAIAHLESRFAK